VSSGFTNPHGLVGLPAYRKRLGILALAVSMISACTTGTRPPAPPSGEPARVPYGAVNLDLGAFSAGVDFGTDLANAVNSRFKGELDRDASGRPVFRVLALSGGGSRGAYGAGVLVGWTAAGTRPQFDVVTGISTGALMATFAFLGSEYDHVLRGYTEVANDDVFVTRNAPSGVFSDALRDTAPLRELIATDIDARLLEAVAREHATGRRLFVGTTNLDSGRFTLWDLGALAASDRPDKLDRYRDVLLASASFPMLFPPVYIPVVVDGETRWQMHVDGSARANVFATTFMLDLDDALQRSDFVAADVHKELWVIHNGQPVEHRNQPVRPRVTAIAEAAINSLLEVTTRSGLADLYVMAMLNGFDFAYTAIPAGVALGPSPLEFDRDEMGRVFALGFEAGRSKDAWQVQLSPTEPFELMQILDPTVVRAAGGRYPVIPHRPPRWMAVGPPLPRRVSLTLCTARPYGNYHRIGVALRERLARFNVVVELVPTAGSQENLRRLRDGSCDAGIAQHDAYFLEAHAVGEGTGTLRVRRPRFLFEEFVHVLCNRSTGARRLGDLLERPEQHQILVGEPDSGSAVTWEVFKRLDPAYEALPTEAIGTDAAIDLVARDEIPACLLYVASLDTPLMRRAGGMAASLRLVALDNRRLNNVRISGERVYQFDRFPTGAYPGLQGAGLPTVTVGSSILIDSSWAERHLDGFRLLRHAVGDARRDFDRGLTSPVNNRRTSR